MEKQTALHPFQNLVNEFDHFILDGWSLLHNGLEPYYGVNETLAYLKSLGKTVLFLINSPRQGSTISNLLLNYDIAPNMYDYIWTSGDHMVNAIRSHQSPFNQLGNLCYVVDNAFDGKLMNDANLVFVDRLERASFVLLLSVSTEDDAHDETMALLEKAKKMNLPAVCPNPNTFAVSGSEIILKPGFYAYEYVKMGGEVHFFGKPAIKMFEEAHTFLGKAPKERVAVVGNQMMTDMIGAMAYGFKTIFVMQDKKYAQQFGVSADVCRFKYDTSMYDQVPHDMPMPDFIVPEFRLSHILETTIHMGYQFQNDHIDIEETY